MSHWKTLLAMKNHLFSKGHASAWLFAGALIAFFSSCSHQSTPRAEKDLVTIMSGTEYGYTLGTPIGLFVPNEDQRPGDYKEMNKIPRPGHADFTYQVQKIATP